MDTAKLLAIRPKKTVEKLGADNKLLLLNSHDIFRVLKEKPVIIMACNIRIRHAVPGIMRAAEETDSLVGFELARTEGNLEGGYTGQTPESFFKMINEYAEELNFSKPYFIHADHTTVKDTRPESLSSAKKLIVNCIENGYTSVSIDASHNEVEDNIRISTELGRIVLESGLGLEVEVGEIKLVKEGGALTTVEEALEFIEGIDKNGIKADLLAINNGSKHGNYAAGEEVSIDLKCTGEIAQAIKPFGVTVAQHGITGTPLNLVGQFADHGIRKGNVGTEWQNVVHDHLPEDLMAKLKKWAADNKEDIKKATKVYKNEIDNIPEEYKKAIYDDAYRRAKAYFKALRSEGTAGFVGQELSR